MRSRWKGVASACVGILLVLAAAEIFGQSTMDLIGTRRRASGAPVAPVFEGWETNPDGTFTFYYGYMNRNFEEEVDIPVGPNNFFSPGPQDRGQPTHFLVNRQKKAFTVIVPKDFGTGSLVWTLIRNGSTETVPGKISPLLQVEATKDADNSMPKLTMGPDQTIALPQKATLTATIASTRPASAETSRRGRGRGGARMTIRWRAYRSPGKVTFSETAPALKDGVSSTIATFSEPGVYVLQAIGDDGGTFNDGPTIPGFICCWALGRVTVTVK